MISLMAADLLGAVQMQGDSQHNQDRNQLAWAPEPSSALEEAPRAAEAPSDPPSDAAAQPQRAKRLPEDAGALGGQGGTTRLASREGGRRIFPRWKLHGNPSQLRRHGEDAGAATSFGDRQ